MWSCGTPYVAPICFLFPCPLCGTNVSQTVHIWGHGVVVTYLIPNQMLAVRFRLASFFFLSCNNEEQQLYSQHSFTGGAFWRTNTSNEYVVCLCVLVCSCSKQWSRVLVQQPSKGVDLTASNVFHIHMTCTPVCAPHHRFDPLCFFLPGLSVGNKTLQSVSVPMYRLEQ